MSPWRQYLANNPRAPRASLVQRIQRATLVKLSPPREQLADDLPPLVVGKQYLATMPYNVEVLATFRGWLPSQDDLPSHRNAIGDTYLKPESKLRSLLKARTRSRRNQKELWTITTTCATRSRKSFQAPNNCRKDEFPVGFGVKPRRFRRCPGRIDRAQVSSKIWDVIGSVAYCFDRPFHPSD